MRRRFSYPISWRQLDRIDRVNCPACGKRFNRETVQWTSMAYPHKTCKRCCDRLLANLIAGTEAVPNA